LQKDPWKVLNPSNQVPGLSHLGPLPAKQNRGGKDGQIPAGMVAGGEGPMEENKEKVKVHLWVLVAWLGMAGGDVLMR